MQRIGVVLEPLETLFFRGGRPFGLGLSGESGLPAPQTFAGAMRTWFLESAGVDFSRLREQPSLEAAFEAAGAAWLAQVSFRGPWPAGVSDPAHPKPFVRAPADLVMAGGRPALLRPLRAPLPGWTPPEGAPRLLPLWLKGDKPDKARPEWLTLGGLRAYLEGRAPGLEQLRNADDLYLFENRTGIKVEERTQAAEESLIYSARYLRLRPGIAFYGEVDLPADKLAAFGERPVIPWGGERRHVLVRRTEPVQWPEAQPGPRVSLFLLTPAFFAQGWRPDNLPPGSLRGAAVDGPFTVSGWDLAKGGPKPARFGVAAGSVYHVEGAEAPASLSASPEDTLAGYGHYLKGAWDYAE